MPVVVTIGVIVLVVIVVVIIATAAGRHPVDDHAQQVGIDTGQSLQSACDHRQPAFARIDHQAHAINLAGQHHRIGHSKNQRAVDDDQIEVFHQQFQQPPESL